MCIGRRLILFQELFPDCYKLKTLCYCKNITLVSVEDDFEVSEIFSGFVTDEKLKLNHLLNVLKAFNVLVYRFALVSNLDMLAFIK